MGRWAAARRRGGGGATPAAAVTIVAVVSTSATEAEVQFSGPVVAVDGATSDSGITFDGDPITNVHQNDATHVNLEGSIATPGIGWDVASQPAWLTTPISFPETGVIV